MEQQNELRLTKAEKRIIAELRQLKYGEMRIVMRNGVPFRWKRPGAKSWRKSNIWFAGCEAGPSEEPTPK